MPSSIFLTKSFDPVNDVLGFFGPLVFGLYRF